MVYLEVRSTGPAADASAVPGDHRATVKSCGWPRPDDDQAAIFSSVVVGYSSWAQGIDSGEIIESVQARRAPMMPVSVSLRL